MARGHERSSSLTRIAYVLLWQQRRRALSGMVCAAGSAAVGGAYAYLSGPMLQTLLSAGNEGIAPFRALVAPVVEWRWRGEAALAAVAVVLVLLALAKGGLNLLQTALLEGAKERIGHELRRHVYGTMLTQPLAAHRRFPLGDVLARCLDDTRRVHRALIDAPLVLVREGFAALALLGVAIYLAPKLALVACLAVPLIGLSVARLSRRVRHAADRAQGSLGELSARGHQALAGLREVKASDAVERELTQLSLLSERLSHWEVRRAVARSLSPFVNEIAAAIAIGITLIYAAGLRPIDASAPGAIVSFFAAVLLMYKPIKGISNAVHLLAASGASRERLGELLDIGAQQEAGGSSGQASQVEVRTPDAAKCSVSRPQAGKRGPGEGAQDVSAAAPGPLNSRVALHDACFRYPGQPPIFDSLSIEVGVGEVLALTGRSGSGKSTLVDILCGLELLSGGALLWDGERLAPRLCRMLPRQVGLVSQRPLLFDGTVAQNLRYGSPEASDDTLWAALRAAGLDQEISALPDGLGTLIGGGGRGLSQGQAQRLVISRALVRRVRLMLFDEPASALDSEATMCLAKTLDTLRQGCAVLLVSHRPALVERADRVLQLVDGRLECAARSVASVRRRQVAG
jgi:subfamily B ATP-binding cassette protein MsbA